MAHERIDITTVDIMKDRRYTIEQLLTLWKSPLVRKPPELPPSEDWMGYVALWQSCRACAKGGLADHRPKSRQSL